MKIDPIVEEIVADDMTWTLREQRQVARNTLYIIKDKRKLHNEDLIQLLEAIPATFRIMSDLFGMTPKMLRDAMQTQHIWRDDIFEQFLKELKRMYK